jgi:hypothetical protein
LFSLCLGCFAGAASAQQVSLGLGSGSTNPGGQVTLNLALTNSGGGLPVSIEWTMTYPPSDIVAVTAAAGGAATQALKSIDCQSSSGSTTCIAYGMNTNSILDGSLASLKFQLGTASAVTIPVQIANPISSLAGGEGVVTTGTGGLISVSSATPVLTGLNCAPTTFSGSGSSACSILLSSAASTGGFAVKIASNNSNVSVPSSITVPQGSSSGGLTATVKLVTNSQTGVITATAGAAAKSSTFTLSPSGATPVLLSSVACSPSSLSGGASTSCVLTLTDPATASVPVSVSSNNTFLTTPSSVMIVAGKGTATFTATAGKPVTQQSAVVTATGPNNSQAFTETMLAPSSTISMWSTSTVPQTISENDSSAVELGVQFQSSVGGSITGLRFYKGPQNTGTHIGNLWTASGKLLATVTFTKETATGWQTATFSSPVTIQPKTTYVASYHTSAGYYSQNENYFNAAVTNGPLEALSDSSSGGNGLYRYGSGGFPNQTWNASNYWVDVLFAATTGK